MRPWRFICCPGYVACSNNAESRRKEPYFIPLSLVHCYSIQRVNHKLSLFPSCTSHHYLTPGQMTAQMRYQVAGAIQFNLLVFHSSSHLYLSFTTSDCGLAQSSYLYIRWRTQIHSTYTNDQYQDSSL